MKHDDPVSAKTARAKTGAKRPASDNVCTVNYVSVGSLPETAQDSGACARVRANVRREHWSRQPSIVTQFWQRVHKTDGCWLWTGNRNHHRGGYGTLTLGASGTHTRLSWYAHRFSYELHYGRIPEGMKVCHRCDHPPCVNPAHLFLGTQGDNVRDAAQKGRLHVARPKRRKVSDADIQAMRKLRAEGWMQEGIAERFGVSESFVSLVLRGKRRAERLPEPSFHAPKSESPASVLKSPFSGTRAGV